jgi:type II secretory pathway pseudopilin PulG
MTTSRCHRCRRRQAFSLLEILVAVSLLTVIVAALLVTFNQVQQTFRRGVNQVDVLEGGRTATLMLSRELQELSTAGSTNSVDFVAMLPNGVPPLAQRLPGGDTRMNVLQDLTFVSRVNDDWFVTAYRVLDRALGVGALYRWSARTNYGNDAGLSNLVDRALQWQPDPAVDSRVIDGVIHFRFVTYAPLEGTNGMLLPEMSLGSGWNGTGNLFPDFRTTNALPTTIDMELGILEPKTLAYVRARSDIPSFDARGYLSGRATRVHLFKQRIPIRASLPPNSTLFSR